MSNLVFQLVTWNGADILPKCLASLESLKSEPCRVIVIDNNSQDSTAEILADWAKKTKHSVLLLRMSFNTGFVGGHNLAFRLSHEPIVCLLNQDIILDQDFVNNVIAYFNNHSTVAGISPLLFSWRDGELGDRIDTAGLEIMPNGQAVEWLGGQEWHNSLAQEQKVFGSSGACPVFERLALEKTLENGNIFDPRFENYKEDVDLAWRLQTAGLPVMFVPRVFAWHRRSARGVKNASSVETAKNRKTKSPRTNALSWRNHWFVLLKSAPREFWKKNWLRILWYEWKKFIWLCLFERQTLRELPAVIRFFKQERRNKK